MMECLLQFYFLYSCSHAPSLVSAHCCLWIFFFVMISSFWLSITHKTLILLGQEETFISQYLQTNGKRKVNVSSAVWAKMTTNCHSLQSFCQHLYTWHLSFIFMSWSEWYKKVTSYLINFSYNSTLGTEIFYNFLQLANATNDKTIVTNKICSFCDTGGVTFSNIWYFF